VERFGLVVVLVSVAEIHDGIALPVLSAPAP
jgi:hypothetical protein